jgi:hypothetical protein
MSTPGGLQFLGIFERGVPYKERIHFQASTPLNLAYYAVLHSTAQGQGVASGGHPCFWFPTLQLMGGEIVVLFTGPNMNPTNVSPSGRTFFWGHPKTIFNSPSDCVVVMQLVTWQTLGQSSFIPQLGNMFNVAPRK